MGKCNSKPNSKSNFHLKISKKNETKGVKLITIPKNSNFYYYDPINEVDRIIYFSPHKKRPIKKVAIQNFSKANTNNEQSCLMEKPTKDTMNVNNNSTMYHNQTVISNIERRNNMEFYINSNQTQTQGQTKLEEVYDNINIIEIVFYHKDENEDINQCQYNTFDKNNQKRTTIKIKNSIFYEKTNIDKTIGILREKVNENKEYKDNNNQYRSSILCKPSVESIEEKKTDEEEDETYSKEVKKDIFKTGNFKFNSINKVFDVESNTYKLLQKMEIEDEEEALLLNKEYLNIIHPNILTYEKIVYDIQDENNHGCLFQMSAAGQNKEYQTLKEYLNINDNQSSINVEDNENSKDKDKNISYIIKQALNGLTYLHNSNIYHGNLTIDNILIDKNSTITLYNYLKTYPTNKSLTYQIANDIYCLGLILFELIFNVSPNDIFIKLIDGRFNPDDLKSYIISKGNEKSDDCIEFLMSALNLTTSSSKKNRNEKELVYSNQNEDSQRNKEKEKNKNKEKDNKEYEDKKEKNEDEEGRKQINIQRNSQVVTNPLISMKTKSHLWFNTNDSDLSLYKNGINTKEYNLMIIKSLLTPISQERILKFHMLFTKITKYYKYEIIKQVYINYFSESIDFNITPSQFVTGFNKLVKSLGINLIHDNGLNSIDGRIVSNIYSSIISFSKNRLLNFNLFCYIANPEGSFFQERQLVNLIWEALFDDQDEVEYNKVIRCLNNEMYSVYDIFDKSKFEKSWVSDKIIMDSGMTRLSKEKFYDILCS